MIPGIIGEFFDFERQRESSNRYLTKLLNLWRKIRPKFKQTGEKDEQKRTEALARVKMVT